MVTAAQTLLGSAVGNESCHFFLYVIVVQTNCLCVSLLLAAAEVVHACCEHQFLFTPQQKRVIVGVARCHRQLHSLFLI